MSVEQGQIIVGIISFVLVLYFEKTKNRKNRILSYFTIPLVVSVLLYSLSFLGANDIAECLTWAPLFIFPFYFAGMIGSLLGVITKKIFKKVIRK